MSDFMYQLQVTEKQLRLIRDAMELMSRIGMGQLGEIYHEVLLIRPAKRPGFMPDYEKLHTLLQIMQKELYGFQTGTASWGIHSPEIHDDYRMAWELYQVTRQILAEDRWNSTPEDQRDMLSKCSVEFDDPVLCNSQKQPLPKVEHVK
jgi:hypothetical protein